MASLARPPADYAFALVGAATVLTLPFAAHGLPQAPAWVATYLTALVGMNAITCWLLAVQYRSTGLASLRRLTVAYLWATLTLVPLALAYPGLHGGDPLVGTQDAAGWLWMAQHVGFPLLAASALAPSRTRVEPAHLRTRALARSSGAAVAVAAAVAVLAMTGRTPGAVPFAVGMAMLVGLLAAGCSAVVVARRGIVRGSLRGLGPWVLVALLASVCDLVLSLAGKKPASVGTFGAQLAGLVAGGAVLGAIMSEVSSMYRTLADRNSELVQMVSLDPLTRLANRTGLANASARERSESRLVAMLDVDHFKAVNDTHGHAVGDEVLVAVAARMSGALRSQDVLGRWGGEEFVLIVAEADGEKAIAVATRVLEAVRSAPVTTSVGEVWVHLSAGAVLSDPDEDLESAAARADQCLYRAKANGRDRLVVGAPGIPRPRRRPAAVSGRSAASR